MRALLLLLLAPALCRAEVVTFNFSGYDDNDDPFTGKFSYATGSYGTVPGSLSLTVGGNTFTTVPGQPINLLFDPAHRVLTIYGGEVVPPAGFGMIESSHFYLDLWGAPGQFSPSAPPTDFPDVHYRRGVGVASIGVDPDLFRGQFTIDSITKDKGPVNDTPEPGTLLLGGLGALLWACRRKRA